MTNKLWTVALVGALATLSLAQTGTKSGIDTSDIDTACKPCDDFWRFASGAWLDKNPIPAQFASWGQFQVLREANTERLRTLLESTVAAKNPDAATRRLGDFYAACMDTKGIDAVGKTPIQADIRRIEAIRDRAGLKSALLALEYEGGLAQMTFVDWTDLDNAENTITGLYPTGLSLPDRDYYFNEDERTKTIRAEFLTHIAKQLELYGDSPAAAKAAAQTVLDFETEMARARLTNVERRDPYNQFHKMKLADLAKLAPDYDWAAAAKLLGIDATLAIDVLQPKAVEAFNRQLTSAPVDTWRTWLRWRIVNDRAQYLAKPFYDEWFRFSSTVLRGVKEQQPRWKICSGQADERLGEDLGHKFVDKHFPAEAKRRMEALVENLRAVLGEQITAADWLQAETRANALKKLNAFNAKVGYPTKWRDYSRVKTTRRGYLANVSSSALEDRRWGLSKIGKKVDHTEWGMTPPTVNAYYSSDRNEIVFPAGILQPPFFYMDADEAVSYGAIGAVIGHEMGHGFDDQGAKFDADGNLKNWWTDQDKAKFEAKASCIVNQFDSIDVGDGLRHKGKLVTGEALGDLGGLTIAYKAYKRSLNGKPAPVLDGYTGDQRFFLAFARVWATSNRDEDKRLRLNTDPHPLGKYRANATLANMPEFAAAFSCKRGDAMVRPPEQQCKLW
jgi:putative endopeptidase